MKLLTYTPVNDAFRPSRLGALLADGRTVVDVRGAHTRMTGEDHPGFRGMAEWIRGGEDTAERTRVVLEFAAGRGPAEWIMPLDRVRLLAPMPRPASIRDCMGFEKHVVQATRTVAGWMFPPLARLDAWAEKIGGRALLAPSGVWRERPLYYKGNVFSVVGPEADIEWPAYTEKLDFELEIGVFIGRKGRDIPVSEAGRYIAGYTIFNDFSARDIQMREMRGRLGPAKGKDFDTGNAMGPCLVTPDELADPYNLTMRARVNGEEWSCGSTRDMHHRFEDTIAYVSQNETLHPGEFIGAGTVGGGCGLEIDRWLKPGDVVELEIEGLGILRNRIYRNG